MVIRIKIKFGEGIKILLGYPFKRQKPIGNYIVDFYCSTLKLVIEIDGESHCFKFPKDAEQQQWLEELGITVLRFDDLQVKQDMENVLYSIVVNPVRLWKPDRVIIETKHNSRAPILDECEPSPLRR